METAERTLAERMAYQPEVWKYSVDAMSFKEKIEFMAGMLVSLTGKVSETDWIKAIQNGLDMVERGWQGKA